MRDRIIARLTEAQQRMTPVSAQCPLCSGVAEAGGGGAIGPYQRLLNIRPAYAFAAPSSERCFVPIPLSASHGRPSPGRVSLCVLRRFPRVLVNTSFHRNFDSQHAHSPLISTTAFTLARSQHTLDTCPPNPAPAIRATYIVSIRSMLHTAHRGAIHYARFKGRPTPYPSPSSLRSHPAQPHMSPPTQVTYRSTFEPFTTDGELAALSLKLKAEYMYPEAESWRLS